MRRTLVLIAVPFLALLMVAPAATASEGCAGPPCGPIPVIITIFLDEYKGVTFDENNVFASDGKVQYYFDIDQNGYAYDPQGEVKITFKVNKAPPWTRTTIEPTEIPIPVGSPQHVQPEGTDAGQLQFLYEQP